MASCASGPRVLTLPPITAIPGCLLQRALGRRCGGVFTPGPSPVTPTPECCFVPACPKLRVVVICPKPWTFQPGSDVTVLCPRVPTSCEAPDPPAQCQPLLTAGVPWPVRLAAKGGIRSFQTLPVGVTDVFPEAATSSQFLFDFSTSSGPDGNGVGSGAVLAYGQNGTVQAQLEFVYRWCGPQRCRDVTLDNFDIVKCTHKNARFFYLGSDLSTDRCSESVVVLMLQQYCGDAPPDQEAACRRGGLSCLDISQIASPCLRGCVRARGPERRRLSSGCPLPR